MSVVSNNILAGASGQGGGGYAIERSLRFNSGDSAHLSKTFASAGNRKTWTWSGWVKRSNLGSNQALLDCRPTANDNQFTVFYIKNTDTLELSGPATTWRTTNQLFRDCSAWYHIVLACDTTQSTSSDRFKIYVNGDQVTSFLTSNDPSLNADLGINQAALHGIGATGAVPAASHLDGYLADVHFIDGQALAPTDFGETDDNGVWQPKKFAGTYTTHTAPVYDSTYGSDISATEVAKTIDGDAATYGVPTGDFVGYTYSNTNDPIINIKWQNTKGSAISVYIQPWVGGGAANSGTFASSGANSVTIAAGATLETTFTFPAGYDGYFRVYGSGDGTNLRIYDVGGVARAFNSFHLDFKDNSSNAALGTDTSVNSNTWTVNNLSIGTPNARSYASDVTSTSGFPSGHEPIFGFDGNLNLYTLTNTGADTITFTPTGGIAYSSSIKINMPTAGATASVNGGTAVSVANSVETAIATGSGTLTSLVLTGTNKPGFFYIKVDDQILLNSGLDSDNDSLVDTPTNGDQTDTGAGGEVVGNYAAWNPLDKHSAVTLANGNLDISQSSSGFGKASIHVSSGKWYWEQTRTDTVASVAGIALSSVAPSATYLGGVSGTAGFDFSSGAVYSSSPITKVNSSNVGAQANGSVAGFALDCDNGTLKLYINGVLQTANHITFTPGTSVTPAFGTNGTAVAAYPTNFGQRAFAYTAPSGYKALCTANLSDPTIADGSQYFDTKLYTGNGSSQTISGLNMSPDFVWIKSRNYTYFHNFFDAIRGTGKALYSNNSNAETVDSGSLTAFNSNGFDVGSSGGVNASGTSYAAWAWDAGSSNTTIAAGGLNSSVYDQSQNWTNLISFNAGGWNGNGTNPFDADATNTDYGNTTRANGGYATLDVSSLTGSRVISVTSEQTEVTITHAGGTTTYTPTTTSRLTHTFAAVTNPTSIKFDGLNSNSQFVLVGVTVDGKRLVNSNITPPNVPSIASTVRANPSAGFSIVSYAGHNDVCTIGHGLNTEPHFAIFKNRDVAEEWVVYHKSIGNTNDLVLNSTVAVDSASNWNNTTPTSSVISLGYTGQANESGSDYIAYCFAPVEGYSAFGSYTGNGNADGPFVFTGFRPKFLLMKSAGAGNWVIIDSARDTYNIADGDLYPDESNAEGSNPRLDILSNGFKLRSTYTSTNPSGTSVIYAAFAENPFKTARAR